MASDREKAKSKAKKKAMSELKKEMRSRAKAIERGDVEALGEYVPRRSKRNRNLEPFLLSLILTFTITVLISNYSRPIDLEFDTPFVPGSTNLSVDYDIPFIWDYDSGFDELGFQIFIGTLATTFVILKLSQKGTRVRIRYFFSEVKIKLWDLLVVLVQLIVYLVKLSAEYMDRGFTRFQKWTEKLPDRLQKLQILSEKLPGKLASISNWFSGRYEKSSNWLAKITASSREYLREKYRQIDESIQISRQKRAQRREASDSDLLRRYRKIRHLMSDGGMAEVYLVRDRRSGGNLIWKQASPSRKNSLDSVNRSIENEVEVLKSINHSRVPKFIDSGIVRNEDEEVVQVLVMEFIDGTSLDQEMKVFQNSKINPPFDRVKESLLESCEVLEHLADLSPPIYHRDIKPHNIMTSPERGVVLIDFGLAKEIDSGGGVSLSGGAHTEGWSPPERTRAVSGGFTDVYGLGQILWHMLTNEDPGIYQEEYRAEKLASLGHPEWVSDLVNKATFPSDPNMRLQSVAEFRMWLEKEGKM